MSDEGVRVESGESYSSETLWLKIKNKIIKFLAGDRPIILNVKTEVVVYELVLILDPKNSIKDDRHYLHFVNKYK